MDFEANVLDSVAKVLKNPDAASFFCGSLSLICNKADAVKVFRMLAKEHNVQISADGSYGFVIDFIA